jgi:hypothetical protein
MIDKQDGGQAFPRSFTDPSGATYLVGGMSLRDWFAGIEPIGESLSGLSIKALESLAGRPKPGGDWKTHALEWFEFEAAVIARIKYIKADAMITERGKQ